MYLTNPSKKNLRMFEPEVSAFFKDKSVLLLGSAPSVVKLDADFMESFDIIVRVNNYSFFNSCTRTDVFYSMLGGSIKKTCGGLEKDGVKFIFCKSPFRNVVVKNPDGSINLLQSIDNRKTYVPNKRRWFEIPYFLQTEKNFRWVQAQINKIVTTGLSAIVDIHRYEPRILHVAGFDFFSSGLHNITMQSHIKPWPKHHDFKGEMLFARDFIAEHENITCDSVMEKIFAEPDKFPKLGNKPDDT